MSNGPPAAPGPDSPGPYPPALADQYQMPEPSQQPGYGDDMEYASQGGGASFDIRVYLAAVWRFKWVVALIAILGSAGGFLATRYLIKPEYFAQATIWIEAAGGAPGPIKQGQLLDSYAWVELLKSYRVLDHVATNLRLYLSSEPENTEVLEDFRLGEGQFVPGDYSLDVDQAGGTFALVREERDTIQRGVLGDSVGAAVGFLWAPAANELWPGRSIEFRVSPPRDAASQLAQQVTARMDVKANFLRISLLGSNPQRIADILNGVAHRYVDVAKELKAAKSKELAKILEEQLEYAFDNLQNAETALESYRVGTITLPAEHSPVTPGIAETRDPATTAFFELKVQLEQLRNDRDAVQRVLDQAEDSTLAVEALEVITSVRNSSELNLALGTLTTKRADLRALELTFTDQHPEVRSTREEIRVLEEQTLPFLLNRLVEELGAREDELNDIISASGTELTRIPPRAIEEARRRRDVNIQAQLYGTLLARYEEARLAAVSSVADVSVLDEAVAPRWPTNSRDGQRLLLMALVGSLGAGILGAVLLDRLDSRLKYPEQVSHELGLRILGSVPHIRDRGRTPGVGDTSQVVEAFRVIRLNLLHTYGSAGPVVIAITSPAGDEGKSFVSANLGLAFAELGRRTLVIDADVRRGHLHHLLGGSRKPGLTDFLAGEVPKDAVVQSTAYKNLDRIPSGKRRHDGPELLQSTSMAALLAQLRAHYEVIIVDTPPVGAGADALAVGTLTGNVVVIVRTGSTNRGMTEAKLDMLERLPIRILGTVLNDVPASRTYYQYYSYLPGYEATDEDEAVEVAGRIEGTVVGAASNPAGEGDGTTPGSNDESGVEVGEGEVLEEGVMGEEPNPYRQHQRRSQVRQWKTKAR